MPERRIRVYLSSPWGQVSGVHTFNLALAGGLRSRGYDAELLVSQLGATAEIDPAGVPVVYTDSAESPDPKTRRNGLARFFHERVPCIWIENGDVAGSDVIHRLGPRVGVIGVIHSDEWIHVDRARRLGPYYDATVAVSGYLGGTVRRVLPREARERALTIPYGVPVPSQKRTRNPGEDGLRLVYAGRLEERQKRVSVLPEIVEELRRRGVDCHLLVVGDGPSGASIRQRCEELVAGGLVTFTGAVSVEQVRAFFLGADVFMLPSRFEGLPLALLEAMGHGCVPVVCSIRSGVTEVVRDGDNGRIVPLRRPIMMADVIEELAADPAMCRRLSERATATFHSRFSDQRMVDDYERLIRSIVPAVVAGSVVRPSRPPELPLSERSDFRARVHRRLRSMIHNRRL